MKKHPDIHIPPPSYWPILSAAGLVLIVIGVVSSFVFSVLGLIVLLIAVGGWAMENRTEEEADHE